MEETRNVLVKPVSELVARDVVVTWDDDGFPWEGIVTRVESVARGSYTGEVYTTYTIHYADGVPPQLNASADQLVKVRSTLDNDGREAHTSSN